jgi:hypothetical protein
MPSEKTLAVRDEALLLSGGGLSLESGNVAKVLHFFGVPWRAATVTEFLGYTRLNHESSAKSRALCSSDTFFELIRELEDNSEASRPLRERVHSVFVYAGDVPGVLQKLMRRLSGDEGVVLNQMNRFGGDFVVSDELDDFCGVMAGVRVSASKANVDASLVLNTAKGNAIKIISIGHGAIFLKLEYKGVPVFLSTSREIIDIDAELASQNFDVREHFLGAVPLVLYIKWAFAETCWSAPEANACLVIDDPLLKPTHGFVDFQELLSLMKRHKFSTNIAFIPWNWRRSAPEVVRLFKENPENYSVSVHGCDHTRAEFGSSSQQRLYWKAQQALERMDRHQSITGIRYDPVMVFPQGIFSEAAMSALKRTDLIAAVNNDVISADPHRRAVMISEMWDIAVMGYSNFPIFTRRYPWEGIENFAFDALLGKPAITVIHHDYCSDHCRRLVDFVDRLNALKCRLTWRSLGDVVRRSSRQRQLSPDVMEVEMYGSELHVENRSEQPKRFLIRKRDADPSTIKEVRDGSGPIGWNPMNGRINFEIELNPAEGKTVSVKFHDLRGHGQSRERISYKVNAMLRRYLCEIRDNYVTTTKLRFAKFVSR